MNNPDMADIEDKYKVKENAEKKFIQAVKTKRATAFKRNVSKKSRQEWGARMNHLRSIV